jgi:NADH-quinone oxidoreductase subunit L
MALFFENNTFLIGWIPLLLLVSALLTGSLAITAQSRLRRWAYPVTLSFYTLAFLVTVGTLIFLQNQPAEGRSLELLIYPWAALSQFTLSLTFLIDPLSVSMMFMILAISLLILFYAKPMMRQDPRFAYYLSLMSLLSFYLTLTVMANNLIVLFFGWGGVALTTYLLTGFWQEESSRITAGKTFFIFNHIGDIGFILGIVILFGMMKTLNNPSLDFAALTQYAPLLAKEHWHRINLLTLATMALAFPVLIRMAQFPFHIGLYKIIHSPFHAMTLIQNIGLTGLSIYFLLRLNFLFALTPETLKALTAIGLGTSLLAALISLAQTNIFRILLLIATGQAGLLLGGYGQLALTEIYYHLLILIVSMTGLLLGAITVVHTMSGEENIENMGGLKKYLPTLFWPFLVFALIIVGILPITGWFSLVGIIWKIFHQSPLLGTLSLTTLFIMAWSLGRLMKQVFWGQPQTKIHETHLANLPNLALSMVVPLFILALAALLSGVAGMPQTIGTVLGWADSHLFHQWIHTLWSMTPSIIGEETHLSLYQFGLIFLIFNLGLAGFYMGYRMASTTQSHKIFSILKNEFYLESLYQTSIEIIVKKTQGFLLGIENHIIYGWDRLISFSVRNLSQVSRFIDDAFIDRSGDTAMRALTQCGGIFHRLQNGSIQNYIAIVFVGVLFLIFGGVWIFLTFHS